MGEEKDDKLKQEIKDELYESIIQKSSSSPAYKKTQTITDVAKLIVMIGSAFVAILGAFFTVKVEVASIKNQVQNNIEYIRQVQTELGDITAFRYTTSKDIEYQTLSINDLKSRILALEQEVRKVKRALDTKQEE